MRCMGVFYLSRDVLLHGYRTATKPREFRFACVLGPTIYHEAEMQMECVG